MEQVFVKGEVFKNNDLNCFNQPLGTLLKQYNCQNVAIVLSMYFYMGYYRGENLREIQILRADPPGSHQEVIKYNIEKYYNLKLATKTFLTFEEFFEFIRSKLIEGKMVIIYTDFYYLPFKSSYTCGIIIIFWSLEVVIKSILIISVITPMKKENLNWMFCNNLQSH